MTFKETRESKCKQTNKQNQKNKQGMSKIRFQQKVEIKRAGENCSAGDNEVNLTLGAALSVIKTQHYQLTSQMAVQKRHPEWKRERKRGKGRQWDLWGIINGNKVCLAESQEKRFRKEQVL